MQVRNTKAAALLLGSSLLSIALGDIGSASAAPRNHGLELASPAKPSPVPTSASRQASPQDITIVVGDVSTTRKDRPAVSASTAGTRGALTIKAGALSTLGDRSEGVKASAGVADLTIAADTVSTGGRLSGGIDGRGEGMVSVNVGTVQTGGAYSTAIYASSSGGDVAVKADSVTALGYASNGVVATSQTGNVAVNVGYAAAYTFGATAIQVSAGGDATVEAGTVLAGAPPVNDYSYAGATGISAVSGGKTTVTVADVAVAGPYGTGILATGNQTEVNLSGSLYVSGTGILATGGQGGVSVSNTGTIHTYDEGFGIYAISAGDIDVAGGNVSTRGIGAAGIGTLSNGGATTITANEVTTEGPYSTGITATSFGGPVTITAGTVTTDGANSNGIFVLAQPPLSEGAPPKDISIAVDHVETGGLGASGIVALGTGGGIDVDAGSVLTRRDYAFGIYAASDNGAIRVSADQVETRGTSAPGVVALGATSNVTVTGAASTIGDGSQAVVAIAYDGNATVDVASAGTLGRNADAIAALATGDISIKSGSVTTAGDGSVGVYASTATGTATIDAQSIDTKGASSNGVSAFGGKVDVTTRGSITTSGDRSVGVLAYSTDRSADVVNVGAIKTQGITSYGILAVGANALTITNTGSVATSGLAATGIYALSRLGDDRSVTITSTGPVTTSADLTIGIKAVAIQGDVTVTASNVSTTGAFAAGVIAISDLPSRSDPYPVEPVVTSVVVDASNIKTSGEYSIGVAAQNLNGDLTVKATGVTVTGQGSGAVNAVASGGNANVTVSNIDARNGRGVYVDSAGTSTLTVTGDVQGGGRGGIFIDGDNAAVLSIAQGATVSGGGLSYPSDPYPSDTIRTVSGGPTTLNNAGSIILSKDGAFTINAYSGIDITNSGRIVGAIRTHYGNGTITNSGTFEATKDSLFEGDADRFTNSGTVQILPGTAVAGKVTFTGLEQFTNAGGLVDLRNGHAGDVLTLPGTYVATGGARLGLDVSFGAGGSGGSADQLVVLGAATGTTAITLANVGANAATLVSTPIVLVKTGAGSSTGAFTLDPASAGIGFIRYSLSFDPAGNSYGLTGVAGTPVYRLARVVEGAEAVWLQSADAWSSHLAGLRNGRWGSGETSSGSRLWGQAFGGVDTRNGATTIAGKREDIGYRQDRFGGQLGYDLGQRSGNGVSFGVTGGYLNSTLRGAGDRVKFDAVNGGGYVSFVSNGFFANLLGKYDRYWIKASDRTLDYTDRFNGSAYGAQGELGYRLGSASFFVEPTVSLAYLRTDLDDLKVLGQVIDFENADGLRGKAGGRIGAVTGLGNGNRMVIYAGGRAVHDFGSRDHVTLRSGGLTERVGNPSLRTWGEASLGIDVTTQGAVSGFIEAQGEFGSYHGGGGKAGLRFRF